MPIPILGQRGGAPPVPPDPLTLNALQWLRSDSVTLVGSDVDVMVDKTANGLDVASQTNLTRPALVPAVLNGHAAVRSAGAARMISPFGLVYPSQVNGPCSYMAVWAPTSGMLFHYGSAAGGFDGIALDLIGTTVRTFYYEVGSAYVGMSYTTAIAPGVMYTVALFRTLPPLAVGIGAQLYEQGTIAVQGGSSLSAGHVLTDSMLFYDSTFSFSTPYVGDLFDFALFDYCLDPAVQVPLLDSYVLSYWGV